YWNGGTLNTEVTSDFPPSSATVASGGDIDTVSGSSVSKAFIPYALAAAICSVMACTETLIAGTAMRSVSLKSRMVLIAGSRLLSKNGWDDNAEILRTSCGVPFVRDHSTSK